ncbi:MAG: FAD-dependent oxidoreductase [Bacteroidota bacterium]|jgi:heterodisulfide reductase subunit A2
MGKSVIVIGGGIAGMTAAGMLARQGYEVTLLEKENETGGHVAHWDRLFPDRRKASEVLEFTGEGMKDVHVAKGISISRISRQNNEFTVTCGMQDSGSVMKSHFTANALIVATGFDLFEARRKEEYGYGIYNNVITSADLEEKFKSGKGILTAEGKIPKRIGIIHCVGSRDEKVGNLYCSKVCCVTGVKQAIELKEMYPGSVVFSFYMDLRMYDRNFEELYYEAQQKWGISFIRGRLSECAENPDGSIVIRTEDTLTGKPLKMTVDLLILLAGFVPAAGTASVAGMIGLKTGTDGFVNPADSHIKNNLSGIPGVFLAGAVKGPVSVTEAIADARAAAALTSEYLKASIEEYA